MCTSKKEASCQRVKRRSLLNLSADFWIQRKSIFWLRSLSVANFLPSQLSTRMTISANIFTCTSVFGVTTFVQCQWASWLQTPAPTLLPCQTRRKPRNWATLIQFRDSPKPVVAWLWIDSSDTEIQIINACVGSETYDVAATQKHKPGLKNMTALVQKPFQEKDARTLKGLSLESEFERTLDRPWRSPGSLARVLSHDGEAENEAPLSARVSAVLSTCQAGLTIVWWFPKVTPS